MNNERINPPPSKRGSKKGDASLSAAAGVAPAQAGMSEAARALAAEAAQRTNARREAISMTLDGNTFVVPDDAEASAAQYVRLSDTFGTASKNVLAMVIGALRQSATGRDGGDPCPVTLNASIALVDAIRPENELETALALQMATCHQLSTEMMGRAKTTTRTDHLQLYANLAIKLQRTFTAQLEALGKMRGNASQSVRVEHVHVHDGGQAIVGNVQTESKTKRGVAATIGADQSHATE
ncbi:MAG: hypothetical protein ABIO85_08175 [Sphingomicrobium sp.]